MESLSATKEQLRQYCYISCLSGAALDSLLGRLQVINLPAGSTVLNEGGPADGFFFINRGEVEVVKKTQWGQSALLSIPGHGKGFGEMALLTCSPRFATVPLRKDQTASTNL
jgi:CRP-like cAMP-binding protein